MSVTGMKIKKTISKQQRDCLYNLLDWCVYILIVGVLAFLILGYVAQRTLVDGTSMNPTLQDKDSVLVEKLSYRFGEPERYDIVVFRYLHQKGSMRPKLSHNTAKMSFVLFAFKFMLKFGLMM